MEQKDRFGINIRKWCKAHEARIAEGLARGEAPASLLARHEKKLAWLQHERLVHLIVLTFTIFGELLIIAAVLFAPFTFPWSMILMYLVLVVLVFYVRHYFFLENTVQHWYRIAEELMETRR